MSNVREVQKTVEAAQQSLISYEGEMLDFEQALVEMEGEMNSTESHLGSVEEKTQLPPVIINGKFHPVQTKTGKYKQNTHH